MAKFNQQMLNDTKFDWQHKFTFDSNNFFFFCERRNGNSLSKTIQNNNTHTAHTIDIWRHDFDEKTKTATREEKRNAQIHLTHTQTHTQSYMIYWYTHCELFETWYDMAPLYHYILSTHQISFLVTHANSLLVSFSLSAPWWCNYWRLCCLFRAKHLSLLIIIWFWSAFNTQFSFRWSALNEA